MINETQSPSSAINIKAYRKMFIIQFITYLAISGGLFVLMITLPKYLYLLGFIFQEINALFIYVALIDIYYYTQKHVYGFWVVCLYAIPCIFMALLPIADMYGFYDWLLSGK